MAPLTGLRGLLGAGSTAPTLLRVLNLEDVPSDTELMRANLAKGGIGCEMVRVQTRADFVAALEGGGFDLIIADYTGSPFDGLSALEVAREIRPEMPFILVSGTADEDLAVEIMKSGATDYVLKHHLEQLVPAVRRAMNEAEERRERERAEEALRRSEEEYRALVEQIPAAIYTQQIAEPGSSRTSPTLYASPQIESQTGYPPQSFVEDPELWIRILHPEDHERVLAEDRRTDETGEPFRMEYRQITRDGRTVWIRDEAVLVRDEEGYPRFWQGVMYDVTERKATEEELARLASYPTLTPDPIIETSPAGQVTYLNPAAQRLFPDLPGLGPRHPVLSDLPSIERQIRNSGGQPAIRETEVEKRFYQQTIWPVPGSDLLRIYAVDVTERRRAEDALRESEEWFRATFEQAAVGIAHNALNGSWLRVNQRLCDILGYSREELLGRTFQGITYPDDLDTDLEQSRRLLSGEISTYSMEKRYIKKDGSVVWGNLTVSLVREFSGEPKYFIAVVEDITERKQVEQELKQTEERFRQLFEQSVDALFVHDQSGRFIDCNSQACRLLGYTRQELLSLSVRDVSCNVLTEEERALKESEGGTLWQRALAGTPGTFALSHEEENRRKDGTTFPAEVRVGSVDYGGSRMILAAIRDITERKRVEEELRQSEERFRLLAERTNDLICLHEPEGRFLYVSPSSRRLLGYEPQELVGKDPYELIHPEDAGRIRYGTCTNASEGEDAASVTYRIRKKSGEYAWFETLTEGIFDEAGEVVRLQTSSRDVSDRKHAEEALRHSERLFRAIFEQAAVGTVQVGLDGGWIRFNDRFCEILGYTREELTTADFRDILTPEDLDRDLERGGRMLDGECQNYSEEKLIRR
ncbi:MAG: PAS domain S-box protein, partial [Actinomycetota bacterium]|nr:PAS domain S-box protein [Actinomycetota bacterium]